MLAGVCQHQGLHPQSVVEENSRGRTKWAMEKERRVLLDNRQGRLSAAQGSSECLRPALQPLLLPSSVCPSMLLPCLHPSGGWGWECGPKLAFVPVGKTTNNRDLTGEAAVQRNIPVNERTVRVGRRWTSERSNKDNKDAALQWLTYLTLRLSDKHPTGLTGSF